jgi:alpha-tubulin suppressor-like RCC1 family protein
VHRDGTVSCWGASQVPAVPFRHGDARAVAKAPGWTDVAQLAMGSELACALHRDHAVSCQEPNKPIARVAGLADVAQVVTGNAHACARTSDGRVLCWGANAKGQLGDGTRKDHAAPAPVAWCTDREK